MKKSLKLFSIALATVMIGLSLVACGNMDMRIDTAKLGENAFKVAPVGYTAENPLADSKVTMDGDKVKVTVPSDTTCVVLNIAHFLKEEGVLGADTTFTRNDVTHANTGKVYELVGADNVKDLRVWREYGSTAEGAGIDKADGLAYNHADFPASAKTGMAIFMFNENRAELNFYAKRENNASVDTKTFDDTDAVKEFKLTINGQDGKKYVLDIVVEVEAA